MGHRKEIIYESYTEDVVTSVGQQYCLPEDYCWLKESRSYAVKSKIAYGAGLIFASIYCPLVLHVKVKGRKKLPKDGSFYLYGNHTQPVGDAFIPAWVCRGKRLYVPVSPANLGIPVIGRLLPYLGGLPVPADKKQLKQFLQALKARTESGNAIVIYPEAHVWPYYTKIRPFDSSSFSYPVQWNCPVYSMTSTYQKRKMGETPRITVYVDGPFWPDPLLKSKKEQKENLREQVEHTMRERSRESTYEYYQYTLRRR